MEILVQYTAPGGGGGGVGEKRYSNQGTLELDHFYVTM